MCSFFLQALHFLFLSVVNIILHITYLINYVEKLWLILWGDCKSYLEVAPWKSRIKKNHRSKSHSILFFSSTTCLHSSMVHCTEITDNCKSTSMNLWSGKKNPELPTCLQKGFNLLNPLLLEKTTSHSWEALFTCNQNSSLQIKRLV